MTTELGERATFAAAAATQRDELRALFGELQEPRDHPTSAWLDRLELTLGRFADLVAQGGSQALLTTAELAEARGHVITALRASRGDAPLADRVSDAMLAMEAVRHVFRDAADEQRPGPQTRTSTLTADLEQWLPSISTAELAELLGVTPKTLQRWRTLDEPASNDRLLLVHRLAAILARSWTPAGVVAWFDRPRDSLNGETPRALLEDPARQGALIELALRTLEPGGRRANAVLGGVSGSRLG